MQTVTIDILNEKAFRLLQDLEMLQLIRVRTESKHLSISDLSAYKGAMSKQPPAEIDDQLNELRNQWE